MGSDYLYCGPGDEPRRVMVVGYSRKDDAPAKFLVRDVRADGTMPIGADARSEWVNPWFKDLEDMPIDWSKHASMKLKLRLSEQVEGSHRG